MKWWKPIISFLLMVAFTLISCMFYDQGRMGLSTATAITAVGWGIIAFLTVTIIYLDDYPKYEYRRRTKR